MLAFVFCVSGILINLKIKVGTTSNFTVMVKRPVNLILCFEPHFVATTKFSLGLCR